MTLRIAVAGATGWVGARLIAAIARDPELTLVGAVARRAAGQDAGTAAGGAPLGVAIVDAVEAALGAPPDVLIDYSSSTVARRHALAAIQAGVSVVIGTSGLDDRDFAAIDAAARARGVGVVASGNFSLTAALLQHFALIAARHLPQWEVIDYASAGKLDVPSGTARELAEKLSAVRRPAIGRPIDALNGPKEARGAEVGATRVHSVRLPGYVLAAEAVFGLPGERLTLRHDAGESAEPYVGGTLLAARRAPTLKGLVRGLDTLLF